jgi:PAS domain S-box-containing protein
LIGKWLHHRSIRVKLMTIILVATSLALGVAGITSFFVELLQLNRGFKQDLEILTDMAAANSTAAVAFDDQQAGEEVLESLAKEYHVHVLAAGVYDNAGNLFAQFHRPDTDPIELPATSPSSPRTESEQIVEVTAPILLDGEQIGSIFMRVDRTYVRRQLLKYAALALVAVVLAMLVCIPLSFQLQKVISRPLESLADAAHLVTDFKDYSIRVLEGPEDEIGALMKSFNAMLEEIHAHDQQIQLARDELEVRVEARTRELAEQVGERERIALALQESESEYRNLVETSGDLIWSVDEQGRWTFINQACREIYGFEPEEMLGRQFIDFQPAEQAEKDLKVFEEIKNGTPAFQYETVHIRKDGTEVHLSFNAIVLRDDAGQVIGTTGTATNITSRVQQESREEEFGRRLARAERMESLGILAGGVAHDLNNILGPVVGYPDLILDDLPPDHPVRDDIIEIRESAHRAAAVIQDLLTLARRGSFQKETMEINDVVRDYLKSAGFREKQEQHPDVTLEVALDDDLLPVLGSKPHFMQVVMNLVINAMEAMLEGGTLRITTGCDYIDRPVAGYDTIEEGDFAVLRIADTGVGISDSDREKIFEPFYSSKKMSRSGTGLGLAVVYGVVKDHDGYLDIHSEPGRGTEFIIYIPATRAQETVEKEVRMDDRGTEKVLVVDDVREQRQLASKLLRRKGYEVETAENGRAAVELLKRDSFDLVVLDMIMESDFDGLDTYRQMIQLRPGQPCVIASGFSESDRVKEAQQLGVGAYVRKPYALEKLSRAVRIELDRDVKRNSEAVSQT